MQFRDKYRTLTFLSPANNSENLIEPLDFSTIERIFSILQELVLSFKKHKICWKIEGKYTKKCNIRWNLKITRNKVEASIVIFGWKDQRRLH